MDLHSALLKMHWPTPYIYVSANLAKFEGY